MADVAPTLTQVWQTAPPIPGETVLFHESGGDQQKTPTRPDHREYRVSTGSIRDHENELLTSTNYHVGNYEEFKQAVRETGPQGDPEAWDMATWQRKPKPGGITAAGHGIAVASDWKVTGTNPAGQELADGEEKMLLAVADCIHLVGRYVAALNDAGQVYAKADMESKPPAP